MQATVQITGMIEGRRGLYSKMISVHIEPGLLDTKYWAEELAKVTARDVHKMKYCDAQFQNLIIERNEIDNIIIERR